MTRQAYKLSSKLDARLDGLAKEPTHAYLVMGRRLPHMRILILSEWLTWNIRTHSAMVRKERALP